MRIILFTENNANGGMDSFISNLVNYWPDSTDKIILIVNSDHPGKDNLFASITRPFSPIQHKIKSSVSIVDFIFPKLPLHFKQFLRSVLRVLIAPFQIYRLLTILKPLKGDRLMSITGGYPGGETCRLVCLAWAKLAKQPAILNVHNFAIAPKKAAAVYENWLDLKVSKSVKLFIGVSAVCSNSLRVRKHFEHLNKITHIYNGVCAPDPHSIAPLNLRKHLSISSSPICIMLANYEARKGHKLLFRAFNLVNNQYPLAHLIVCGDGTDQQKAEISAYRDEIAPTANIHLLDFIPNGRELINQADMLLVASQELESFGLTVAEAMIREVPVVSTNVGGLSEVLGEDQAAGFSFNPDDVDGFAAAIIKLIKHPEIARSVTARAKLRVHKYFTVERMAAKYAHTIKE